MFTLVKLFQPKYLLILVLILAACLRFYKLGEVPPSISWDEAAVGYNSWTIGQYLRDEWGNFLPPYFKSFEDDKHPVHVYLTVISVAIFGLTDFAVRFPVALLGVVNVLMIYLLTKKLFGKPWIGLAAAISMAISPYNLQFSRFNHEANFALFFFLLGSWLFFKAVNGQPFLLLLSAVSFGVDLITYHSVKVVLPILLGYLLFTNYSLLKSIKGYSLGAGMIILTFIIFILINPSLSGLARVKQTSFSEDRIKETYLYQQTQNLNLGWANLVASRYLAHFSLTNLVISGDINPKFSIQTVGILYKMELLFLVAGMMTLAKKPNKVKGFILLWLLVSPIPASITGGADEVPHAGRALFLMGSLVVVNALGLARLIQMVKIRTLQVVLLVVVIGAIGFELRSYLSSYYFDYSKVRAIDWQFGMRDVVKFVKDNPQYRQVFMTDVRSQPYVFFLYYLKTPPSEFLQKLEYNQTPSRSYSLVTKFNKYNFGNWDTIESSPLTGVLYILTPSQYDGLKYREKFKIKERILYPGGADAFYLVSLN